MRGTRSISVYLRTLVLRAYLLDDIMNVVANGPLVPASTPSFRETVAKRRSRRNNLPDLLRPPPAAVPEYPDERADRDRAGQRASGGEFAQFAEGRCHLGRRRATAPSWYDSPTIARGLWSIKAIWTNG